MPLLVPDLVYERTVLLITGNARGYAGAISTAAAATTRRLLIVVDDKTHLKSWNSLQQLLSFIYSTATQVAFSMGNPLMDIDVILGARELAEQWDRVFRAFNAPIPPSLEGVPVVDIYPDDSSKNESVETSLGSTDFRLFPVVALGGTFDHLHAGHKILLSMAALLAERKIIVGVTDDALLVRKKNKHVLESLSARISRTRSFLQLFKPDLELDIVSISDVYGPTGWDPDIQALVVSRETLPGAVSIASHRKEKNLPELEVFVIDVVSRDAAEILGESVDSETLVQSKMSSTAIRQWIVDHPQDV